MPAPVARKPSKKMQQFLERKQKEQEQIEMERAARHQELLHIINNPNEHNKVNIDGALKLLYDMTKSKCIQFLSTGERDNILTVIRILRKLLDDGHKIDDVIISLLPHGSILFFQFIKQVRRDLLHGFAAMDEVVHACKQCEIIELLEYKIIELDHMAKVNNMPSLEATIYMFIQLTDYDDTVISHLYKIYSPSISRQGLLQHMLLISIPHEISLYLKPLKEINIMTEQYVSFDLVMQSYQAMEDRYKGAPILKGRLINLYRMIVDMVVNEGLIIPTMDEFRAALHRRYELGDGVAIPSFLQDLSWKTYWHVSLEIYMQQTRRRFPNHNDTEWHIARKS
jgi:hypothetical protein